MFVMGEPGHHAPVGAIVDVGDTEDGGKDVKFPLYWRITISDAHSEEMIEPTKAKVKHVGIFHPKHGSMKERQVLENYGHQLDLDAMPRGLRRQLETKGKLTLTRAQFEKYLKAV